VIYTNNKTGKRYQLLAQGVDCTNSRDGTPVAIYSPEIDKTQIFAREEKEFFAKFSATDEHAPLDSPTSKAEIAGNLRWLSEHMLDIANNMAFYGGFSDMAQHGAELAGAGALAKQWAEAIEAEDAA
jgi:hypothetical protein